MTTIDRRYKYADEVHVSATVLYASNSKLYFDAEHTVPADYKVVLGALDSSTARIEESGSYYVPTSYEVEDLVATVHYGNNKSATADGKPKVTIEASDPWWTDWGKRTAQLQEGVKVDGTSITGRLYYVEDFKGYQDPPVAGNYLVTHYIPETPDTEVHVEKVGGTVGDHVITAPDYTLYSLITDKSVNKLKVYGVRNGVKGDTVAYDLSGLTLDAAPGSQEKPPTPTEPEEDLDSDGESEDQLE